MSDREPDWRICRPEMFTATSNSSASRVEGDPPDMVKHPPHYNGHPTGIECITIREHCKFSNLSDALKYIWRVSWCPKGDAAGQIQDLKKAEWYIRREIDRREKEL